MIGIPDINDMTEIALGFTIRRLRISSHTKGMRCPKCKDTQLQLIAAVKPLAKWKCRICKHKFTYEPLIPVKLSA